MQANTKHEVELRQVTTNDIGELSKLFQNVIPHTFVKEGLPSDHEDVFEEINYKMNQLNEHLELKESFYLLATINGKIVGTIWYGETGELIIEASHGRLSDHGEIGTVFVLPDYQGQGVGKVLFEGMMGLLRESGHTECALDSGYRYAQKVWKHLLGEPVYIIKDKWGPGYDHLVWEIKL